MANLKKAHLTEINKFLSENDLFNFVNVYLQNNNLAAFEVDSLKLKSVIPLDDNLVCPPNHTKRRICRPSGRCDWECVPND